MLCSLLDTIYKNVGKYAMFSAVTLMYGFVWNCEIFANYHKKENLLPLMVVLGISWLSSEYCAIMLQKDVAN